MTLVLSPDYDSITLFPDAPVEIIIDTTSSPVQVSSSGLPGRSGTTHATFFMTGDLLQKVGEHEFWVDRPYQIVGGVATVSVAPQGNDVVIDVNVAGASLWTDPDDRPRIAVGERKTEFLMSSAVTLDPDTDYVTVDVDEVGSTYPGRSLTVQVWLH